MSFSFDREIPATGYSWWYLDGLSDDGRFGITVIAFLGSVFSPYYARARRTAPHSANPLNHCALNVALYAGPGARAPTGWAMTERGVGALQRSATRLQIGPSALEWSGSTLSIHINEITAPLPSRMRGVVRLHAASLLEQTYPLDAAGLHHWCPIAPTARVDVDLSHPALRWSGRGYLDTNRGQRPLEDDFVRWDWSRAALPGQRSAVLYDVSRKGGNQMALALAFDAGGGVQDFTPPVRTALPSSRWGVARSTRSDAGGAATITQRLEDGPFYARSVLQTRLLGEPATAFHESLDLRRFSAGWVQCLLPFRMPRRAS